MTGFDLAAILVICFFGIIGWIRGFSWQLMGVATIVLGFTVAYPLSGWLEPTMATWLGFDLKGEEMAQLSAGHQRDVHFLARGAAWAAAFALIWLVTHAGYYFFREAIERWHMEELNRSLGGLFGLLKGVLIVGVVVLVLVILGVERTRSDVHPNEVRVQVPRLIEHSMLAPSIIRTLRVTRFALPSAFATGMTHYLDALDDLDDDTGVAIVEESGPDGGGSPRGSGASSKPEGAPPPEGADGPDTPPPADDGAPADGGE